MKPRARASFGVPTEARANNSSFHAMLHRKKGKVHAAQGSRGNQRVDSSEWPALAAHGGAAR
jgi:hypothetical protein